MNELIQKHIGWSVLRWWGKPQCATDEALFVSSIQRYRTKQSHRNSCV